MAGLHHILKAQIDALEGRRQQITEAVEARIAALPADAAIGHKLAAGLTDAERAELDDIDAKLPGLNADYDRAVAARDAKLREPAAEVMSAPPGQGYTTGLARTHDRAADKPWGYDLYRGENKDRLLAAALGDQLQAVYRARVQGQHDPRLRYQAVAQGAGIAAPEDGGFLLAESVSDAIMLRAAGGEILSRVNRQTMGAGLQSIKINVVDESSRATGSRFGGVQAYWVDEGTAPTATRPKFHQVRLEPHKLAALGYATDELIADASMLGSVMFRSFTEEVRFLTENAVIRGTGAGQPQGILNATALISVAAETGQEAATVLFENITKMYARMYAPARSGAVWLMNQDIEPQLFSMNLAVGTGGIPVYMPPTGVAAAPYGTLYGRPLVPVEYCSTLGTVGDLMLVNLSEYMFIDRGAPQEATSMHVAFTTDEMAFRLTWRVDGQPMWRTTLTPFQGSNTQSPFIALATRS